MKSDVRLIFNAPKAVAVIYRLFPDYLDICLKAHQNFVFFVFQSWATTRQDSYLIADQKVYSINLKTCKNFRNTSFK
jgi:hypothetical protein